MKNKITNLSELRNEIERLNTQKELKELQLTNKLKGFSEQLKPINLIKSAFSSITGDKQLKSDMAIKGSEAALGFLVSNLIFKNSNPIVRTAATILGTSFATKIFGDDSTVYIEKIKNIYKKFMKKRREKKEDAEKNTEFNEEDIYTS